MTVRDKIDEYHSRLMKNALHIPIKQIKSEYEIDVLWTCKECGKLTAWSQDECQDCDSDYQYDVMRDNEL